MNPPAFPVLLRALLLAAAIVTLLAGCSRDAKEEALAAPSTLITVTEAVARDVPVVFKSMGRLESRASPAVAAEVDGRVLRLAVDEGQVVAVGEVLAELDATSVRLDLDAARADAARIAVLVANEQRRAERLRDLHAKGYIAREQLDDVEAQLAVLRAQRDAVAARVRIVEDQRDKTVVHAPLAGRVEKRLVSTGDFVKRGMPLFELSTSAELRAVLPFPEQLAARLAAGLAVHLRSPLAPEQAAAGVIAELRPAVGAGNRAVWAVVDLANPGGWRPGATVFAEILVATHSGAVVVPARSLVRRPAGDVVYAVRGDRAEQRVVTTGERLGELVEITAGLAQGELVALEGASYLSDGTQVRFATEAP